MRWWLAASALLLAGCGSAPPAPVTGTLTGTVVAAPCRPVERAGDPPCPPVAGVTVVIGPAQAVTDSRGVYRVSLPAGSYAVTVRAGVRTVPASPAQVTVQAEALTTVNLTFDSGIR